MEWALGIEVEDRRLVARVLRQDGEVETVELDALHRRGLPTSVERVHQRSREICWGDFRTVDSREYVDALGLRPTGQTINSHMVFEVAHGQLRYLVPALVLIRAMCRHSSPLIPVMFAPQAIDRISDFDWSEGTPRLVILDSALYGGRTAIRDNLTKVVEWLKIFPSAFRAAASIHDIAMAGGIGMTLPGGRANVNFRGHRSGSNVFVTDMSIQAVTPDELPSLSLPWPQEKVHLHSPSNAESKLVDVDSACVTPKSDGSFELTDKEWESIAPMMSRGRQNRGGAPILDQRKVLDGLLTKLGSKAAWLKATYTVGTATNAQHLFRTLTKRGVMTEVLAVLHASRTVRDIAT